MTDLTTYIGEKKALVFPVMCDGYLQIDYTEEVAQENYGIFGHDSSLTIETILTPYDVNGLGYKFADKDNPDGESGVTNSQKTLPASQSGGTGVPPIVVDSTCDTTNGSTNVTMNSTANVTVGAVVIGSGIPSNTTVTSITNGTTFVISNAATATATNITITFGTRQSYLYRNHTERITHKMVLFHNDGLEFYLLNNTTTNQNQPAEYQMGLKVLVGSTTDTLESISVFSPKTLHHNSTSSSYYHGNNDSVKVVTAEANVAVAGHTPSSAIFTMDGANDSDNYFFVGQNLFVSVSGTLTSIGSVAGVETTGKDVTMDAPIPFDASGMTLYTDAKKEAPYLLSSNHLAATYDATNGNMSIYFDGELIATKIHSGFSSGAFVIEPNDCYIGQDPNTGISTQFMGELHEFAILKGTKTEFNSLYTLAPNYRNILLYYRFEETDL